MAVRFKIRTVIEEMVPHKFIRTVGEGKESRNLGQFKQKTRINFNALSEDETEISYQSEVSIVGKLATFGDRVLKAKAKEFGKAEKYFLRAVDVNPQLAQGYAELGINAYYAGHHEKSV